ncbi:MAG: hypothetical protein RMJ13_06940 [Elusimicrobiota bacterium]|nr:hypothetical protein [Elusimicrobiota bacterium]
MLLFFFSFELESSLFLTADADVRLSISDSFERKFGLEAVGISLRKVFTDNLGDRLIFFSLVDIVDNFRNKMLDQIYLQYKGPLGRWNITLGRYILPFGLLANYSSKRLLFKTLEYETIGIESDNGVSISGVISEFDYALSLTQGVGTTRWVDIDKEILFTARFGYQSVEFESWNLGLSCALGRVIKVEHHMPVDDITLYKKLFSIDLTKYFGPAVLRSEISFGKEDEIQLFGLFSKVDYAILPKLDFNLGYSYLIKNYETHNLTLGVSYSLYGFIIRAAYKFGILGGVKNEFLFQIYKIFSYSF